MRVLIVAPEWPPNVVGGGGPVYERIGRFLAQRGHTVSAAFTDTSRLGWRTEPWERSVGSVSLLGLPPAPVLWNMKWLRPALPPNARGLRRFRRLLAQPWDVAHLHAVGFPLVDFAAWVLRGRGIPYVFTAHGIPASPLSRGFAARTALMSYLQLVTGATIRHAARYTAVSAAVACSPMLPRRDAITIHNGIDEKDFDGASDHRVAARPLRIVSLGGLSLVKGADTVLRVMAQLRSMDIDATAAIYGHDHGDAPLLLAQRRELALDSAVEFKGPFNDEERRALLRNADVLLAPSRVEGFGIAAVEALAAGLPVVASRVEGMSEVLESCALLAPPGDPAAFAAAIRDLLDPARRATMIEHGRSAARRFLWSDILPRYEAVLESAARC
ncbi:MAG: glycosyltransferase family 4 protein [Candidatus Eremiobacter antarcticus]|nr:glycosyltransferase family 4 protein [Candidatus Eremiobacteraeota bacterium]